MWKRQMLKIDIQLEVTLWGKPVSKEAKEKIFSMLAENISENYEEIFWDSIGVDGTVDVPESIPDTVSDMLSSVHSSDTTSNNYDFIRNVVNDVAGKEIVLKDIEMEELSKSFSKNVKSKWVPGAILILRDEAKKFI